ncbi:RNA polymerase sigma factor [Candidatus Poribacteria bacterium]
MKWDNLSIIELITLFQEGNVEQRTDIFAELFRRHKSLLLRYIRVKLGKNDTSDSDTLQKTFIIALKKLPDLRRDRWPHFRGWLRRIADYLMLQESCSQSSKFEIVNTEMVNQQLRRQSVELPPSRPEMEEYVNDFGNAFRKALSPGEQKAIIHYLQGNEYGKIMASTGMTYDSARKARSKAITKLSAYYQKKAIDHSPGEFRLMIHHLLTYYSERLLDRLSEVQE